MHAEVLGPLTRLLPAARRQAPGGHDAMQHLPEQRDLRGVDAASQLADAAGAPDVHALDAHDVAGVDARIDEMDRAAHRRPLEPGPFRDVHPTVSRQDAHVSVQRAKARHRE